MKYGSSPILRESSALFERRKKPPQFIGGGISRFQRKEHVTPSALPPFDPVPQRIPINRNDEDAEVRLPLRPVWWRRSLALKLLAFGGELSFLLCGKDGRDLRHHLCMRDL